ncbi:MAG: hypothetical protein ACLP3K_10430 [Candidatus Acidiferrales bacterium]
MILKQFYLPCLAHASCVIGDDVLVGIPLRVNVGACSAANAMSLPGTTVIGA